LYKNEKRGQPNRKDRSLPNHFTYSFILIVNLQTQSHLSYILKMSKRKFEEDNSYDDPIQEKKPFVQTVTLSDSIYDTDDYEVKPVDIKQEITDWKEFTRTLGFHKVFFSELGHPDPSKREKPLILPEVHRSEKGLGLSHSVYPSPHIANAQVFPDILEMYKSEKNFYIMLPMKLTEAFMYPIGNFQRQFSQEQNFCPQDEHDSIATKFKFSMCYNNSAPNANYSVKDPVACEGLNWLQSYEIELRKIKGMQDLKPKFCKERNNNLEVNCSPFVAIPPDVKKAKGVENFDFTPIHKYLAAFQSKKTHLYKGSVPGLRLNPDYNKTEDSKPLILIPEEEQHAYQLENDYHLVCFKANRKVHSNLVIDLAFWISLEAGYEGSPGSHWFDQAKPRPILMTKEELFNREQNPLKTFESNLWKTKPKPAEA